MEPYQLVRLITDKYQGLPFGSIGVILENYNDHDFEVEFSDEQGNTIELFTFPKEELELVK